MYMQVTFRGYLGPPPMKYLFSFTEPGKAAAYIKRVTLDLVRARRETQDAEKVRKSSSRELRNQLELHLNSLMFLFHPQIIY